jgi:uncharacterized protein YcaQ
VTRRIDAAAARRFLVRRHLLAPPRSAPSGPDGVMAVFASLGSVQFDPLAVAGRNHDLVLHARVADYDPAWTEQLLYERRALYETYNKSLSLVPTAELPWYRVTWDLNHARYRDDVFVRHSETIEHVLARIREHGPQSTLDFERRDAVDWWWGPTNEIRAAMEALAHAGVLGLARRDGNRRYYDLVERLFPPELLAQRPSLHDQRRHRLLSRYRAHGLLGTGGQAELWLGTGPARRRDGHDPDDPTRYESLEELLAEGVLLPVQVEGVRGLRYILREDAGLLAATADRPLDATGVTFLAPLDPLVWDRDLLRQLFGFDYIWEVYVPEAKRRWGYYVLPILFGDRLVGRIEPRIERRERRVRILGLWWEDGFDPRRADGFVDAMRDALAAYGRFGGVDGLEWAPRLGAQGRLFGTRPAGRRRRRAAVTSAAGAPAAVS